MVMRLCADSTLSSARATHMFLRLDRGSVVTRVLFKSVKSVFRYIINMRGRILGDYL